MTKRLLGFVLIALIGVAAVAAGAVAQGAREDGSRPGVRSGEPGSSAGVARGERGERGRFGAPSRVEKRSRAETRSGDGRPPSLGDPNRGMSGYYRNRIGMTPPSARGGRVGSRGGGGRGGGGRR